ncbi:uncharacterized protein LOC125050897 isoform X2 [Pieris napi]|uniref:uncharacterized protein LOC125050897 isoform X2 n=1 Tax=Pieris napi TaxID=78633 RepID=UPI001FB92B5E|nr:uncharacterized protein LOC125050897 isoform X2 [Pieris napi]
MWLWVLFGLGAVLSAEAAGAGAARLVCYVETARTLDFTECTHLIYTGSARGEKLDGILKDYRKHNPKLKIILRVTEDDKDLKDILVSKYIQGLELYNAHQSFNRTKTTETVEYARSAISAANKGPLILALPAHPELLAKYYDLRALVKKADLMMVHTHALGLVKKMTYHPSRLSGMWDMMNTDSVVDLVIGLGVPASKLVVSLPATAQQFTLQNQTLSTPGSPAVDEEPKEIDQAQLCRQLQRGRWTLERDQDLSAPYAFKNETWISFEDSSSVDVKGKYARVRGLAGLALYQADRDVDTPCGSSLRSILQKVLNQQSRAPRAAVLRSLENEILSVGGARGLEALQVSPYRITQVVDADGVIHSIREDTRTEFSCSRQGYFVHPRSCARFYRCVKFDQYSPDYTVFEFDCPAGLAFDARYEVCVWPGSLPNAAACPGSAEIAPVPSERFQCPAQEGFYVDPENCRWFFACLDHGKSPLTAYEFRCPFGLGFDPARMRCDWPWLVPACGNIARYEAEVFGFSAATLTGATGFQGRTAESVNIAAHHGLEAGATVDNLVGIQTGFLNNQDALDDNFISAQELDNFSNYQVDYTNLGSQGEPSGLSYKVVAADSINKGLVQATNYNDEDKYTSGSIILDDYRLPTNKATGNNFQTTNARIQAGQNEKYKQNYAYPTSYSNSQVAPKHRSGAYRKDNRGAYMHNPIGDRAHPYKHIDIPALQYKHIDFNTKDTYDFDRGTYSGTHDTGSYSGTHDTGSYSGTHDTGSYDSGPYRGSYDTGPYNQDVSKSTGYDYPKPTVPFNEGLYNIQGNEYTGAETGQSLSTFYGSYGKGGVGGVGSYLTDSKIYHGAPHTLTAGAINVDLVGKTTLVDGSNRGYQYTQGVVHDTEQISKPAVSITHVGTNSQNRDGYTYVTTPTLSGIPTIATPFAVSTSLPSVTYKTTYVPQPPRTSVKQLFGYTQPAVTYVQPTVVTVTDHNQSHNTGYSTVNTGTTKFASTGNDYSRLKFEEGISYSNTPVPVTVTKLNPQSFSHTQQGFENTYPTAFPVTRPPIKKVVAYTTGAPAAYVPSIAQSYSHQTVHNLDGGNVYIPAVESGGKYTNTVSYETSTPQPIPVVPLVETNHFGKQTVHTVNVNKINSYPQEEIGYESRVDSQPLDYSQQYDTQRFEQYSIPITGNKYNTQASQAYVASTTVRPIVTTAKSVFENPFLKYTVNVTPASYQDTYVPQTYNQQTIHRGSGYRYKPTDAPITLAQPAVSTYQSQDYSKQNTQGNNYQETGYDYSRPSIGLKEVLSTPTPAIFVSTEQPQVYSQQTVYTGRTNNDAIYKDQSFVPTTPTVQPSLYKVNYETGYSRPLVTVQESSSTTPIEITERPLTYSQTSSTYDKQVLNENSQANYQTGYDYSKPSITLKESGTVSTLAPVVLSTESPHSFSQQTFHRVEKQRVESPLPRVQLTYQNPAVSVYENPILKYTQKTIATDVSPTGYTQYVNEEIRQPTYNHQTLGTQNFQTYTYDQPEIQRNVEVPRVPAYSDASVVSHQTFHQSQTYGKTDQTGKDAIFVSTTPSTLIYEDHYSEYNNPKQQVTYNSEYVPSRSRDYYTVSTVATPVRVGSRYKSRLDKYNIESIHQSTYEQPSKVTVEFPSAPASYSQSTQTRYDSPEIQVANTAEEYLPPAGSPTTPVITSTYRPRIYSTTSTRDYLPPITESVYKAPEYVPPSYLPPTQKSASRVVTYDTFGYDAGAGASARNRYNTQEDNSISTEKFVISTAAPLQRKQNVVVETAKSNVLGFGTVGPDAGLISTYTPSYPTSETYYVNTAASSTSKPDIVEVTSAPRRSRPKYFRPAEQSSTQAPLYVESTTYEAPEYLPPSDEFEIKYNPYQNVKTTETVSSTPFYTRKQNIVVKTAKSNVLGFGSDTGRVTYSTSGVPSSTVSTYPVTSTYTPVRQELVEVTSTQVPIRRYRPKVAVVTKINDFNPLLVRKLGAVCSCQSPVLVLKGRRPTAQTQIIDDYSSEDISDRGDIDEEVWQEKSRRVTKPSINTVTTGAPTVTSTYNPIIVPDDSYYQDYQEASNDDIIITPAERGQSENYVSRKPVTSTTENVIRIRPRVKAVTVAPTYKSVILNQEVSPQESLDTVKVDSQSFDRYGPGGWRGRDETLQGSIDCQRAGLFRHPKQCNKFYACRWDCTKQRFTLHVFNCPVQLSFDPNIGACNWPSQGPACQGDTLLTNTL